MNGVVSSLLSTKLNGALHHGVLPHENHRVATQTFPYALELRRANVFGGHDQNLGILAQKTPELLVVQGFLLGPRGFHGHFFNGWQREKKKKTQQEKRVLRVFFSFARNGSKTLGFKKDDVSTVRQAFLHAISIQYRNL